ncbi:MAG: oxidative damage protection protein [Gammaproteobacteria bacterium]|nr:oxidative damage protection protein [Gammaproteobacteria bacterium]
MSRIVHCAKLKKDAEGLPTPTYPGELGKRIYLEVSAEAWQLWLNHQTMLINEYRLSLIDPKAREFLKAEMEKFLFSEDYTKPAGYVPPEEGQA